MSVIDEAVRQITREELSRVQTEQHAETMRAMASIAHQLNQMSGQISQLDARMSGMEIRMDVVEAHLRPSGFTPVGE